MTVTKVIDDYWDRGRTFCNNTEFHDRIVRGVNAAFETSRCDWPTHSETIKGPFFNTHLYKHLDGNKKSFTFTWYLKILSVFSVF